MGALDRTSGGVRTSFIGAYFLISEEPKFEATEERREVGEDSIRVTEIVDPHLRTERETVFFEECGRVVGVWWWTTEGGVGGERAV